MTDSKSIAVMAHSPRTVRVALGDTSTEAGGAELQLAWTAQLLRDRGWQVKLVMPLTGEEAPVGDVGGFEVVPAHHPGARGVVDYVSCTVHDYLLALATANARVYLHRGTSAMAGWTGLYCQMRGRKAVLSAASNLDVAPDLEAGESRPSRFNQALFRYYLRHCDAVFVQSPEQAALYAERWGKQAAEIANIADIPPQVPAKSAEPLVAWAGAIRKCKRPLWVLEIARGLPWVKFKIAGGSNPGEDALWEQLQAEARELPNVELLGWLRVNEVEQLIGKAWACLCTSQMEGFPNIYLMAWGQETPVVTSFGAGGLVERSSAGFIGETPQQLIQVLEPLLRNETLRRTTGEMGRQYALANHSRSAIGDRYDMLLSELLER